MHPPCASWLCATRSEPFCTSFCTKQTRDNLFISHVCALQASRQNHGLFYIVNTTAFQLESLRACELPTPFTDLIQDAFSSVTFPVRENLIRETSWRPQITTPFLTLRYIVHDDRQFLFTPAPLNASEVGLTGSLQQWPFCAASQ